MSSLHEQSNIRPTICFTRHSFTYIVRKAVTLSAIYFPQTWFAAAIFPSLNNVSPSFRPFSHQSLYTPLLCCYCVSLFICQNQIITCNNVNIGNFRHVIFYQMYLRVCQIRRVLTSIHKYWSSNFHGDRLCVLNFGLGFEILCKVFEFMSVILYYK